METLFKQVEKEKKLKNAPLAVRMRPSTLDEYVGQRKAVGPGSWLRSAIEHDGAIFNCMEQRILL